MNKRILFVLAGLAVLAVAAIYLYPKFFSSSKPERKILYWTDSMLPGDRSDRPGKSPMGMERTPVYAEEAQPESSAHANHAEEYYTCPMHPSVRSDKPGACPVCHMALVKKTKVINGDDSSNHDMAALEAVRLSSTQRVMANVATMTVDRRALNKEINAVGVVEVAEPNFKHISSRFPGRLEKLYLSYTGQQVQVGDPVAEVYSPEAISAQQEFLLALQSQEISKMATGTIANTSTQLFEQAQQKLVLLGLERLIPELQQTRKAREIVTTYSPIRGTVLKKSVDPQHYTWTGEDMYDVADLSIVWMYLEVYEKDIRFVKTGQPVRMTSEAYPNEAFTGKVTFIDPTINNETRTVRVRAEFANREGKLRLGLYVKAQILIPSNEALVVPTSAVLTTGKRTVVWIEVQENMFEPREVVLGAQTEEYYEVLSGLQGGEKIVVTGGFLLDSESQLQQAVRQ
ncbi:MAG: efflux RND transporter periplasmic adaptor subunit [candidate division KSB1 bacterium]